jgi:ribonuclease BN (tRNA processing enzyme)
MYMSPPLFPVHLDDIPAHVMFHDAPEDDEVTIGSATIRAAKVAHQGPTVGYRIEEHGRALVYLPDHEPAIGTPIALLPPAWISGNAVARGADVLLHDAQYRAHEYGAHIGWGHSPVGDAVEFARKADIERLVLFHHDPYHTDTELEELLAEARAAWPGNGHRVCLAYEGMTVVLDGDGVQLPEGRAAAPGTH